MQEIRTRPDFVAELDLRGDGTAFDVGIRRHLASHPLVAFGISRRMSHSRGIETDRHQARQPALGYHQQRPGEAARALKNFFDPEFQDRLGRQHQHGVGGGLGIYPNKARPSCSLILAWAINFPFGGPEPHQAWCTPIRNLAYTWRFKPGRAFVQNPT